MTGVSVGVNKFSPLCFSFPRVAGAVLFPRAFPHRRSAATTCCRPMCASSSDRRPPNCLPPSPSPITRSVDAPPHLQVSRQAGVFRPRCFLIDVCCRSCSRCGGGTLPGSPCSLPRSHSSCVSAASALTLSWSALAPFCSSSYERRVQACARQSWFFRRDADDTPET